MSLNNKMQIKINTNRDSNDNNNNDNYNNLCIEYRNSHEGLIMH
jgi:hypothetical protein